MNALPLHRTAFTLIEFLIVFAVISLLAALAVPSLVRAQRMANESATQSLLHELVQAQESFRVAVVVDQDEDGIGEYGFLPELTGLVSGRTDGAFDGPRPDPPFLPQPLGVTDAWGHSSRGGFKLMVYLPTPEKPLAYSPQLRGGNRNHAELQEQFWVAYAWPAATEPDGLRRFAVGPRGHIYTLTPGPEGWNPKEPPQANSCPPAFRKRPPKQNPPPDPTDENLNNFTGGWTLEK
ncbi:MAG: type II secretion system protein [Planctomycetota bacterium]|nr:type II secretion system protein [Planctomycetota bacterium]